jgi:4'-phosphopantetheinyl transferase EntD
VPIDTESQGGAARANPAVRSLTIEALFPDGVAAAELRVSADPSLLEPEEAAGIARAAPKRVREFTAGRLCARAALARFGVVGFAVRAATDRRPLWPDGLVGSITHTLGFRAAVVAEHARFIGVGLDTERARAVKPELWRKICVEAEIDWLESLPTDERIRAAALIFSAKEAFYKAQYPHTREVLGFADLRIVASGWGDAAGTLSVEPQRPLALYHGAYGASAPPCVRYRFHEEFVSVGAAIRNDGAANTPCRRGTASPPSAG